MVGDMPKRWMSHRFTGLSATIKKNHQHIPTTGFVMDL
jgi:hypothetical protein